MALTLTKRANGVHGHQKFWQGTIGFDNSYPTAGEALTPASVGFSVITHATFDNEEGVLDRIPVWDKASGTLQLVVASTGLEAANASDQSSVVVGALIYGY